MLCVCLSLCSWTQLHDARYVERLLKTPAGEMSDKMYQTRDYKTWLNVKFCFGAQGQYNDAGKKKSADIAYLSVCVCARACVSFFLVYSS
jgi:hypothetical protein